MYFKILTFNDFIHIELKHAMEALKAEVQALEAAFRDKAEQVQDLHAQQAALSAQQADNKQNLQEKVALQRELETVRDEFMNVKEARNQKRMELEGLAEVRII